MKTINFTISGDAAAAIDKTIMLRAASPHVSNIIEVHIVRPQALPTTYTVKFVIPEHVEINVAYKLNGVNKIINNLDHDATVAEKTIMVDKDSVVKVQIAVETGWTLDDASEKTYTITADTTITIDTPYIAGPTPYTLSWNIGPTDNIAGYPSASFGITYIAKDHDTGGMKPAETIDIEVTGSKTVYEGDKVVFWDNCNTHFSATGATMSGDTITIGESDVQVTGDVPEREETIIPSVDLIWYNNPSSMVYCTVSTDGTHIDATVHLEELHLNDMGIESYNQFFFGIWDGRYGNEVYPASCNPVITPAFAAECFICQDDGAGPGAGSLTLIKDISDLVTGSGYKISGTLKFKQEDADEVSFDFDITFVP